MVLVRAIDLDGHYIIASFPCAHRKILFLSFFKEGIKFITRTPQS
jgi:hypothetical protein